jgi:hypothetical protein
MLTHLAAGTDWGPIIFIVVVAVFSLIGKLVEKLRGDDKAKEEERRRRLEALRRQQDAGNAAPETPVAAGLEALLQALQQNAARQQPTNPPPRQEETGEPGERDDEFTRQEREHADDGHVAMQYPAAGHDDHSQLVESLSSPTPELQPAPQARRAVDRAAMDRAAAKVEESRRLAREAERDAERASLEMLTPESSAVADATRPSDATSHEAHAAPGDAGGTAPAESAAVAAHPAAARLEAALAGSFTPQDARTGIIWQTVLGRPRGVE